MPAGWKLRPWPVSRACFALPQREEWENELNKMKEDLGSLPNRGLPLPDGSVQPAFNCYAWNEFGESGVVAPTHKTGYMKLEGLKAVFSQAQTPTHANSSSRQLSRSTYCL